MHGKLVEGDGNLPLLSYDGYFLDELNNPVALGGPQGPPLVTPYYSFPKDNYVLRDPPERKVHEADDVEHHLTSPHQVRYKASKHMYA